ncbi:MAG: hypothetical protein KatS3mg022_3586 [Armatimonadota bacterium]|nr:MAG: hypothetical protein KatS3mg022_3586 [Armatimonadota bacterium]
MKHHVTLKQIERELRAMGLLEDWRTGAMDCEG